MDDKKLFRISDVAKMFRVSTGRSAIMRKRDYYARNIQIRRLGIAIIVYGNLRC